jgi:hypothetical protein
MQSLSRRSARLDPGADPGRVPWLCPGTGCQRARMCACSQRPATQSADRGLARACVLASGSGGAGRRDRASGISPGPVRIATKIARGPVERLRYGTGAGAPGPRYESTAGGRAWSIRADIGTSRSATVNTLSPLPTSPSHPDLTEPFGLPCAPSPGTSLRAAAPAWSTRSLNYRRCRKAHAWKLPSHSATASHCTGSKSDVRTSEPTRPG